MDPRKYCHALNTNTSLQTMCFDEVSGSAANANGNVDYEVVDVVETAVVVVEVGVVVVDVVVAETLLLCLD